MGSLPHLLETKPPKAAFRPTGRAAMIPARCLYTQDQAKASEKPLEVSNSLKRLGSAVLSAALTASIAVSVISPNPANATDNTDKRRAELQRRKDLLAKARDNALQAGGFQGDADSAPPVSATEDAKVLEATAEVEKGNQAREKEAEKMRQSLKSSLKNYESAAQKDGKQLKPGVDQPDNPSWFTDFLDKKLKKDEPVPDAPAVKAPEPASKSFFSEFLAPKSGSEPEKAPSLTAPNQPSAPGALKDAMKAPSKAAQPEPAPPKKDSKMSQPEPKSPPPAPAVKPSTPPQPSPTPALPPKSSPPPPPPPAPTPKPSPAPFPKITPPAAPAPSAPPKPTPPQPPAAKSSLLQESPSQSKPPTGLAGPSQKKAVQPIKAVTKSKKVVDTKKGKRTGPLPATLVQLLILAAFGGIGYLSFFKEDELNKLLSITGKTVAAAYDKVESIVKKRT